MPVQLSLPVLERLATACGVPVEQAARAAVALLARRYTGRAVQTVRSSGTVHRFDLTEDGTVRRLLAQPHPDGMATPTAPDVPPSDAVDRGADLLDLLVESGADGRLAVHGCPAELAGDFAADLVRLIDTMAADPDRSTVDLLPESAYEQRRPGDLATLHGGPRVEPTGWSAGAGDTICTAFAAQVARHPDRHAVLADDGQLTYRQLGSAVAATAAAIRAAAGDTRGGRAALLCRHGATAITGMLAALVSGRAYVPLEPSFPAGRLAHILADSDADVLLVDAAHADLARGLAEATGRPDLTMVHIGTPTADTADLVPAGLAGPANPDDPAYLLYTSGSTGEPKAVVQSHRNVLFGVANHIRNFAVTPADRTSVLTSFGYDMAVTDTFSAILSGAAAVPADIREHGLGHLERTLSRHGVTIYHSTPTVYRYLLASLGPHGRLPGVRAVLLGGEEVTRHDVELARRHFAPGVVFVNGYGTTEISFAAQHHLPPGAALEHAVVPVGHPLDGIEVALVDAADRRTCLTGEVVVRCPHVALGYWGRPELSASRFRELDGVRAYWTGDIARRLPDGRLIYLGRADRMVKIRGYRVELGEVESRLAALPGVGHAAVVARDTVGAGPQTKEIIAYAVPARGATIDPSALRAALAEQLPDYMVPRTVVIADALPMGPTGKLDVRALPAPPALVTGPSEHDPLEQVIAATWCDVLGVDGVDRDASFFELGGHSLLLALVQERLEPALGRRIGMPLLLEHPTVAALAAHLREVAGGVPQQRVTDGAERAADRMRRRREARQGTAAAETTS
ncbi:non-ribosomal peptide synthetase [Catellatospora sp. TT07R-123]|uniref:non-ribosomal peptide synthetase n=1 Tax=Catellatospora sp. TT07R-123 TaxID=2733863 RepID=UPI001FD4B139|nr:non-ribosomal peptide synthetase [Catellatospora sp. TT07R-123]